ncbi:transglycosylase SLT domain-containing protein [Kitasatospora sp. NPDC056327]|uniref:aggregation-promoting factor C-terminal-like domain-containing protein n=1 Tax=Kitasatospora sp. NPDC056327 TaxID=3345785 RepID=UPI0035E239C9
MPAFKLRMRTSAAVLAGAAGLTALGAGLVPATASAATASPQTIAAQIVPANQLAAFKQIISHESSWNVTATNPSSGAYGLAQALPGSKMATHGTDWKTNPTTQIRWALDYMNDRYGSPNAAWAFWQTHHWY